MGGILGIGGAPASSGGGGGGAAGRAGRGAIAQAAALAPTDPAATRTDPMSVALADMQRQQFQQKRRRSTVDTLASGNPGGPTLGYSSVQTLGGAAAT